MGIDVSETCRVRSWTLRPRVPESADEDHTRWDLSGPVETWPRSGVV